jgi:hypothetical protein
MARVVLTFRSGNALTGAKFQSCILAPPVRASQRLSQTCRQVAVMQLLLVGRFIQVGGQAAVARYLWKSSTLIRVLGVVKCQPALMWFAFRSCAQAAISSTRDCLFVGNSPVEPLGRQNAEFGRRPDRADRRALECNVMRSTRPGAWLRRPGRLRKADVEIVWTSRMILACAKWRSAKSFKTWA